jgi:hypothetical protein
MQIKSTGSAKKREKAKTPSTKEKTLDQIETERKRQRGNREGEKIGEET